MTKSINFKSIGVAIVALPMLLYGASSFDTTESTSREAIRVGDQTATVQQVEFQVSRRIDQIAGRLGFDAADPPDAVRYAAAEEITAEIIRSLLMQQLAADAQLQPLDEEVTEAVKAEPTFIVDGQFSPERFRSAVQNPQLYLTEVRRQLAMNRINEPFTKVGLATPGLLELILRFQGERRIVRKLALPVLPDEEIEITEEDIKQEYTQNLAVAYSLPERIQIEYVHVTPAAVADRVTFDEEALRAAHERRNTNNLENEERQLAMIMLTDEAQAKTTFQELQGDADFAATARKRSEDAGSKEVGGDIGFVTRADLPEAITSEVFAAEVGSLLGPFADGDNWLIFEVKGQIGGSVAEFEDVRAELEAQVRRELADIEQNTVAAELDEQLVSLGGNADLATILEPLGLTSATTDWIELAGEEIELPEPLEDSHLHADILAEELRDGTTFSPLLRRDDGTYLVVRVSNHEPLREQEFEEVRDDIVTQLRRLAGVTKIAQVTNEQVRQLAAGEVVPELDFDASPALEVDQLSSTEELKEIGLTPEQRESLFFGALLNSTNGLPAYYLSFLPEENTFILFRIDEIIPAASSNNEVTSLLEDLLVRTDSNTMLYGYIEEAIREVEVDVNLPDNLVRPEES